MHHHIYNRGAHKALIFIDRADYWRMLKLLYIANNTKPFIFADLGNKDVFQIKRDETLVDIVAYCLMPNHIHIAIRTKPLWEVSPTGTKKYRIANREVSPAVSFIHKLCTAYSGYFNRKYDHSGTIWQGPYKDKRVHDQEYIQKLINYIHLNPYGIKEPSMTKEARSEHLTEALAYSKEYEFSSYKDYLGEKRQQSNILSNR